MRTASFRDDVLWAVARKLGLDPSTEFLTDEGESLASFITAWVRRSWDASDFPEWALIQEFTPDANHLVPYRAFPVGAPEPVTISRPLKVYLVDPRVSPYPIDTRFRMWDEGLHVGFDHGATVWIKYLGLAPRFTSINWDPNKSYDNGELAYSPRSGECYQSLVGNNLGNDPVVGFPTPLPTQITQTAVPPNPGVAGQDQIVDVVFRDPVLTHQIPNPPPNNSRFFVEVVDVSGGLLGNATVTGNGVMTLAAVVTSLQSQLLAALTGFTSVTVDTSTFTIRITDNSSFRINQAFWGLFAQPNRNVPVRQIQTYMPFVASSPGQPQITQVTISADQARGCTTYTLTFRDMDGDIHTASYYAEAGEGLSQIINGLVAAINGSTDPWFAGNMTVSADPVLGTIQISTMGGISTDAQMIPEVSTFWTRVLFPYALIEPVVDGAYADALREAGQTDKAMAEQQNSATDFADRVTKALVPGYTDLTDARAPAPRYRGKLQGQNPTK